MRINYLVVLLSGLLLWSSCGSDVQIESNNEDEITKIDWEKIKRSPTKFKILDSSKTGVVANNKIQETDGFNHFKWASIYNGSGVGVADFNNDGLPDIYMGRNMQSDVLYLNKGNMEFEDISALALPEDNLWTSGVSIVDINNDGLMDIYICKFGPTMDLEQRRNHLLVNRGNNRFRDEAKKYGLDDHGFSTQAAFFDVDKDGDKDVYIVNQPPDSRFIQIKEPTEAEIKELYSDRLYIREDDGKYVDRTVEYGVQNYASGLNVLVNDVNDDGWLDLYVSNDYEKPDYFYINQGGKSFINELEKRTGHISNFAMGSDVADINNDGLNDIGVLDMSSSDHYRSKTNMGAMNEDEFWKNVEMGHHYQYMFNTLQLNQGEGYFSEIAQMSGIAQTDWSWSILFEDFNLDGLKDCYVTNGIKKDIRNNDFIESLKSRIISGKREFKTTDLLNQIPSNPISNYYFESKSPLIYNDASKESGIYDPDFSTGCSIADFDQDGDYDIIASVTEGPAKLIENQTEKSGSTLSYVLDKSLWNEFLNAKFILKTNYGTQRKDVVPVRGYLSSFWDKIIFGLPEGGEIHEVYATTIYGDTYELPRTFENVHVLSKQNIKKTKTKSGKSKSPFFKENNSLDFVHEENSYNDFKQEILLPHKLSEEGPCTALVDVTGSGEKDLFIGGSLGMPLTQYRRVSGNWQAVNQDFWSNYSEFENRNLTFFDKDGDGDLDLYIANGGNENATSSKSWLVDQLFENDKGNFELSNSLPQRETNSSIAIAIDIENDKDEDLVVFGAHKVGQYPRSEASYVLENKEGIFTNSESLSIGLEEIGIVSDAIKLDYNNDGFEDIVVVGSWSNPQVLLGNGEKLRLDTPMELNNMSSWWESIYAGDFNGDGRKDLVFGSFGENNKFHPSAKKPLEIFGNDFDGSGSNDVVLAKHYKNKVVPTRGRECSSQQIPDIQKKFPTFDEFALAGIEEILGEDKLEEGVHKKITGMSHQILWNKPEGWVSAKLPAECQIAPLKSMASFDVNKDGIEDIIGIGNHYGAEVETARYDAGFGWVVLGSKTGNLTYVPSNRSGLRLNGDGRSLEIVQTPKGTELIAFFNNAPAKSYLLN